MSDEDERATTTVTTTMVRTSAYRVAGEAAGIEVLREGLAAFERRADMSQFQLETLLAIVKNDVAPMMQFATDPKLIFAYVIMRKIVESLIKQNQVAQKDDQQTDYAYGFPASEEIANGPEAFNFSAY